MIIVKLSGGLGNQMFQYVAGRSLANRLKTNIYLNLSFYRQSFTSDKVTPREYELDCFKLEATILSDFQLKIIHYLTKLNLLKIYHESGLDYNSDFTSQRGNLVIDGYWQSEKYFSNISTSVRNDFDFKHALNKGAAINLAEINKSNSISAHIRRSDYVSNTNANKTHGLCSVDYYQKAIKYIAAKTIKPHIFIFSDDIPWCRENLHFPHPTTYISNNKNWEDLKLMSACKHNVIANSSFSWWGAWLNENKNKLVIAPSKWFADIQINPKDRFPKDWILL